MTFVHPAWLALAALVPLAAVIWVFMRGRAEKRLDALVAPALRARLLPSAPRFFAVQAALLLIGFFLLAVAAARPRWGHSEQTVTSRSRNVAIAIDVSRSMLAEDVRPNRLERAKADVADLIDELGGDRAALVAFRRTGVLICPLTSDRAFLRSTLEGLAPESAPRGETDLGAAIRTCLDALNPEDDDHNAVILISDGGDLRGGAVAAAETAKARGVPVFTVGLGDNRKSATIPGESGRGTQKYKDQPVQTKLEDAPLAEIAKISGGRYVPLATAGTAETTLGAIYRRFLRQVAAREQAEEEERRATERFGLFLVPGLLCVLAAAFFSRGRFSGARIRKITAATCVVFAALVCRAEETKPETDGEVFNRGVDLYRAGDATNALAVLKPLLLSRTHGPRAAELVADLAYQAGDLEEASAAAQIALRASPEDGRANRNFTRATDRVQRMRDDKHAEEVMRAAQGRSPGAILGAAVKDIRDIMEEQKGVLTNEAHLAIVNSEALAKRAAAVADAWIPVRGAVAQSVTNEQQAAEIFAQIEVARDRAMRAADALEDLDPAAATELADAEGALTQFWKVTVEPPAALDEDIFCQTNAYRDLEPFNGRTWQTEALDFTRAFRRAFPAWAAQYEQMAQTDTNKPPFTKEQQDEINALMGEVEKIQLMSEDLPKEQLRTLAMLERVRELLPKDKNGSGGQPPPQAQPQQKPDDDKKNEPQQSPPENDKQDEKSEQQESSEQAEPKTDDETEALLQKAQDRSDRHEQEKKARMRKAPLSPNERDW